MKNPGIFATACAAINCDVHNGLRVKLFDFPDDDFRCKLWVLNCRRLDLFSLGACTLNKSYKLCYKHFEKCMFKKGTKVIKSSAVPTVFDFPTVTFPSPLPSHTDLGYDQPLTHLPLGVIFEAVTRVVVMNDGKLYITGGPLLNPGSFEIEHGKVFLKTNKNISPSEDMFYCVPVLIGVIKDGKISSIEHFLVLSFYLTYFHGHSWMRTTHICEVTHHVCIEDFLKGVTIKLDVPLSENGKEGPDSLGWENLSGDSAVKSFSSVTVKPIAIEMKSDQDNELEFKSVAAPSVESRTRLKRKKSFGSRPRPNILRSRKQSISPERVNSPSNAVSSEETENVEDSEGMSKRFERIEKLLEVHDKILGGGYLFTDPLVNDKNLNSPNENGDHSSGKHTAELEKQIDETPLIVSEKVELDDEQLRNLIPSTFLKMSDMIEVSSISDYVVSENKSVNSPLIVNSSQFSLPEGLKKTLAEYLLKNKDANRVDAVYSGRKVSATRSFIRIPINPKKSLANSDLSAIDSKRDSSPNSKNSEQTAQALEINSSIDSTSPVSNDSMKSLTCPPSPNSDIESLPFQAESTCSQNANVTSDKKEHQTVDSVCMNYSLQKSLCVTSLNTVSSAIHYSAHSSDSIKNDKVDLCKGTQPTDKAQGNPTACSTLQTESAASDDLTPHIRNADNQVSLKPVNVELVKKRPSKCETESSSDNRPIVDTDSSILGSNVPSLNISLKGIENRISPSSLHDPVNEINNQNFSVQTNDSSSKDKNVINTLPDHNCLNEATEITRGGINDEVKSNQNTVCLDPPSPATCVNDKPDNNLDSPIPQNVKTQKVVSVSHNDLPPHIRDVVSKISPNPGKILIVNESGKIGWKPFLNVKSKCYCRGKPLLNTRWNRMNAPPEHKILLDKYNKVTKKLRRLEKRVKDLKEQVKNPPKIRFTRILEELPKYTSTDAYTLISAGLKVNAQGIKSRGFRFSEEMKELGARLLLAGPKVYKTFASIFTMPSKKTIRKWNSNRENKAIESLFSGKEYGTDQDNAENEEIDKQNNEDLPQLDEIEHQGEPSSDVDSFMEDFSDVQQELVLEEDAETENFESDLSMMNVNNIPCNEVVIDDVAVNTFDFPNTPYVVETMSPFEFKVVPV